MSREIANRHWSDAFETFVDGLGGEFRRFGAVVAFLGNLPIPFANGCLVLEEADPRDLEEALGWVVTGRVPYQVRVDETVLEPLAMTIAGLGLVHDPAPLPAMVLRPIPTTPRPGPGVTVAAVTDVTYADFQRIIIDGGIPADFAKQIFPRLSASKDAMYFLASLDGRPAGTSVALRTGPSGGIYSVATLEVARRRGVGTAVTWAAVDAIRKWGCTAAVLQSSAMGYPVYRSMGFADVVRYVRFVLPAAPAATRSTQDLAAS